MTEQSHFLRMTWLVLACVVGMTGYQVESSRVPEAQNPPTEANPAEPSQLVIDTVSLPTTYPHATYSVRLQQHGGVPPFHWRIEKGELPRGMQLEDDGTLHGSPEIGEYRFTISLTDSSKPPQAVQRQYLLNVIEALSMTWKTPAHAVGNRIEGSVQVSNATSEDFDFTFIVLAVNENGRANAIGYQHFPLKKATTEFELTFGDTVPRGAYVVHVDSVGEVPEKNEIHRVRLQTPALLQVTMGP